MITLDYFGVLSMSLCRKFILIIIFIFDISATDVTITGIADTSTPVAKTSSVPGQGIPLIIYFT